MMTKERANRLGMYADIRQVLDAALTSGGGNFVCENYGAAVHWRQRAYKFRKLYAETYPGKESPYDVLILRRVADNDATIRIEVRQSSGLFIPQGGVTPVDFAPDDELEAAANRLREQLEGKK